METAWVLIFLAWFGKSCIHPSVKWDYRVPVYRTYTIGEMHPPTKNCFSYESPPVETKDFVLYFKPDKYQLKETDIPKELKSWTVYAVYGSADNTGTFLHNMWLSLQRAKCTSKIIHSNTPIGILPGLLGRFVLIKTYKKKLPVKARVKTGGVK